MLVKSGEYFQLYRSNTPAPTLAVVFSSRASRPPDFTFWKKFQYIPCNVIYLNSPVFAWYRTGIPGIPGGLRGLARLIEKFAKETSSSRIVAVGSSMGAYGAALLGHFTHLDEMLLFGLEPLLGVPGGRTDVTRNRYMSIYPDLRQINFGKATIFYGEMDINDVIGAGMLHDKRKGNLVCIPFAQHDTPEILDRSHLLDRIFERLIAGKHINLSILPARTPHADNESIAKLWEVNESYSGKEWKMLESVLAKHSGLLKKSYLAQYISAVAAYKLGHTERSITAFETITQSIPLFWEGWLNLSAAYNRKGHMTKAIHAATNALRLQPSRSIAHFQLSAIYEKSNLMSKALEHATWAHRLNNANVAYQKKLSDLSAALAPDIGAQDVKQEKYYTGAAAEAIQKFADFGYFWKQSVIPPISIAE